MPPQIQSEQRKESCYQRCEQWDQSPPPCRCLYLPVVKFDGSSQKLVGEVCWQRCPTISGFRNNMACRKRYSVYACGSNSEELWMGSGKVPPFRCGSGRAL